jgi:hypothetical protein
MKNPSFFEGVAVALAASVVGSLLYTVLTSLFPVALLLRLLVACIGLAYVVYLLSRSRERVGRVTALAIWGLVAGVTWFVHPPLTLYLLVHLGLIWLVRSLYFYSSMLSALADLGLSSLSLVAGIWAATQSGSVFLSLWCFFLVQALFVVIPAHFNNIVRGGAPYQACEDHFQRARRAAEVSVRKLSSGHH